MADIAHTKTDQKLEEMEKRLSAIYSRAEKEIQKTADEYFARFAKQDEAKRKLLEQGKITEDEYKKWRKGKVMYGKRFTEMKEQCAKQLLNVNQTALAYVNGELPEVYAINYNALAGSVDGVGGYSFTLVDADTVRNLAVTDTSLLPYKAIDPAKDIPWNMKKINAETLQGILQGESMDKIAKRLRNVQEMNKTQAIRTARTIVTGAENKGRQDSYARAEADGIILQKEWISTNDNRTRHWHAELDGKTVPQDKPFSNAVGLIMFPGDPGAHPSNTYNCRCTMAAVVKGFGQVKIKEEVFVGQVGGVQVLGLRQTPSLDVGAFDEQKTKPVEKDIHNLPQKPIRPKKQNYATEEEYVDARNRYRKEKELYDQAVEDTIKKTFDRKAIFGTKDEARKWLKSNGIRFSDDFIDTIDIRAFDDIVPVTEKMFEKYPFTRRFTGFDFDGNEVDSVFGFWITADADTFMESQAGIGFAKSYFSDYKEAIKENLDFMSSGWTVLGDGTIRTTITHEFGHRVESYLSQLSVSKYGSTKQLSKEIEEIAQAAPSGSSEYSKTTYPELFAEGFAAYESGEDTEFAKAFGNLLKRWLG